MGFKGLLVLQMLMCQLTLTFKTKIFFRASRFRRDPKVFPNMARSISRNTDLRTFLKLYDLLSTLVRTRSMAASGSLNWLMKTDTT